MTSVWEIEVITVGIFFGMISPSAEKVGPENRTPKNSIRVPITVVFGFFCMNFR